MTVRLSRQMRDLLTTLADLQWLSQVQQPSPGTGTCLPGIKEHCAS